MPRKKTFTIEYALTKALELFRARGYRGNLDAGHREAHRGQPEQRIRYFR